MNTNQTFEQMNRAALKWLEGRDPFEMAENTGIHYDAQEQVFTFSSLGADITLTYPDYRITPPVDHWHYLLILHYLHLADGTPLTLGVGSSYVGIVPTGRPVQFS